MRVSVHVNNLIGRWVEIDGSHEACDLGSNGQEGVRVEEVFGEEGVVGLVVPSYQEHGECQHLQRKR